MSSMFCTKIYICKNADWCARDFNPKSDEPKCFEMLTNADRIRAMTDEELAMAISTDFGGIPWCKFIPECQDTLCEVCVIKWLKQEVEE